MRSKERLIEVLLSVPWFSGWHTSALRDAGNYLKRGKPFTDATLDILLHMPVYSDSPHYQELAKEALFYDDE